MTERDVAQAEAAMPEENRLVRPLAPPYLGHHVAGGRVGAGPAVEEEPQPHRLSGGGQTREA